MPRYGAWQNGSVVETADGPNDAARLADRGTSFGSTAGTFDHPLWGDRLRMSRFAGTDAPKKGAKPGDTDMPSMP